MPACAASSRAARADISESIAPATPLDALLAGVSAPASAEAVAALLALPEAREAEPALRIVGALWHAGGPHAADALRDLVRHEDAGVREAALRGVAVVGLRGASGSRRESNLRRALTDGDPRVVRAAYEALARVGGPDDVAVLIEGLASPEGNVRSLSLRALRGLTGERLTPDAARWTYWWERSRARLGEQVAAALESLETGADELEAASAWSLLERRAWVALPTCEEAARRWLAAWEPEPRRDGYLLAGVLRLGSLAKAVASAARRDATGPAAEARVGAERALGLVASEPR
jgi:HEAT repeat protein